MHQTGEAGVDDFSDCKEQQFLSLAILLWLTPLYQPLLSRQSPHLARPLSHRRQHLPLLQPIKQSKLRPCLLDEVLDRFLAHVLVSLAPTQQQLLYKHKLPRQPISNVISNHQRVGTVHQYSSSLVLSTKPLQTMMTGHSPSHCRSQPVSTQRAAT